MADKLLSALPYYKWYWQDFRANRTVQRMTYVERGLYRELLDECWADGGLPTDIESLADICGCPIEVMASAWQVLGKCFVLSEGKYRNEKLHSLRTEKDAERVKRKESGHLGAVAKSLNNNDSEGTCQASAKQVPSTCHIGEERREEKSKGEKSKSIGASAPVADAPPDQPLLEKLTKRKSRTKKEPIALADWLAALPEDRDAIPADDSIWEEMDSANIPAKYQTLAWQVFKRDWANKTAKDWPATFRDAIRRGWIKIWYFRDGECVLNSAGMLALRSLSDDQ